MDAVFTLPYSEFAVADLFIRVFKARDGYSVFIPVSRTEKACRPCFNSAVEGGYQSRHLPDQIVTNLRRHRT